jgi:hypothetical protein
MAVVRDGGAPWSLSSFTRDAAGGLEEQGKTSERLVVKARPPWP